VILFRVLWWLVALPFRLVLLALGVVLWMVLRPFRLFFGVLSLLGAGRLLQLGLIVGLGYLFRRLVFGSGPPQARISETDTIGPDVEAGRRLP
jgi:hypothetical protein